MTQALALTARRPIWLALSTMFLNADVALTRDARVQALAASAVARLNVIGSSLNMQQRPQRIISILVCQRSESIEINHRFWGNRPPTA
jgi:hypothetical protein